MTKAQKRLQRLFATPSPKDFSWDELLTVTRNAGFSETCQGGSHYVFYHERTGFTATLSRPHKSRPLKQYQIKIAIRMLSAVGATPNAGDEAQGVQRIH